MKKNKNITKILAAALLAVLIAFSSGCSKQRDYGENFNLETDCQHSYYCGVSFWKRTQSDGAGQYILKDDYIYYYNTEKKTMAPLCNKANCLHDMETNENRLNDCNAYAPTLGALEFIQYYDGYIYYVNEDWEECSLYRVKKDGSKKDKIFTTNKETSIINWLIHRGQLYYATLSYYYGEDKTNQVYNKCILNSLELSSNMNEKDAKVIFESDEKHSVIGLDNLKAYKNYICYNVTANTNDVEWTTTDSWFEQLYEPTYIYNIETGENREIPVPEGYSEATSAGEVVFLEDKMLFKVGDGTQDGEYKFPVYSMNYDLTDQKIWLDGVEQFKQVQTYDDYVIISDAKLHYEETLDDDGALQFVLKDDKPCTNVEIYSSDAKRISYFVYPMNRWGNGNFNGFGPDGVNVEFDEDDNSWYVYELNFKDVLNCHGETVKLDLVNTRSFGALNKQEG